MKKSSKTDGIGQLLKLSLMLLLSGATFAASAEEMQGVISTSGAPAFSSKFWGYSSTSTGPGDNAFSRALSATREKNRPLLIVTGTDGCSTCDAFVKAVHAKSTDVSMTLSSYCVNSYFRGNSQACKEAQAFVSGLSGVSNSGSASHVSGLIKIGHTSGSTHVVAFYGEFEDGCKYVQTMNLPTAWESFKSTYTAWVADFKARTGSHKVTATARFRNRATDFDRLEAVVGKSKSVTVPLTRAMRQENDENDFFIVEAPDGTATTNTLSWVANETNKLVTVSVEGDWTEGQSFRMTICDANRNQVDSSAIYFVKEGNAFTFPDLTFDENGAWGQWTLDSENNWTAVTQKVYEANTYLQPDTNDTAEVVKIVMDIPIMPSNRYEVVYTNDASFFVGQDATVSNWHEVVAQRYECYGTNRTFYVGLPGCVTNEDVAARELVLTEGEWATTNFYSVVLTNEEHEAASSDVTWTNFEATVGVDCLNYYYTVTTNAYQYGAAGRENGGRDEKDLQSFILKVTGGVVWNDETVAFASVFSSNKFKDWCQSNKVATVLHECADPQTGASLFSYTVAANGHSGAAFVSRNGLDASQVEQPAASNVFEVALYRPDGTLAGILAPQMNSRTKTCDVNENMIRLGELLALADDMTEPANNAVATTPLEAVYGEPTPTNTLSVSDQKDMFKLNVPADTFISFLIGSDPVSLDNGQEEPQVKVWSLSGETAHAIEPLWADENGVPVWRFSDADIQAGIYAEVTAWAKESAATETFGGSVFRYSLTVAAAPDFPGVISFPDSPGSDYYVDSDTVVTLKVSRTGFTGEATAKISLITNELPQGCLVWANANGATNLVWGAGETGEKIIPLTVRNVLWEDAVSNLVFELSDVTGAALDETKKTYTAGIQQEDDENALTGRIYISSPDPTGGQVSWKKSGETVEVVIVRDRIENPETHKAEARGEASATITVTGDAEVSTNKVEWLRGNRVGSRTVTLTMPSGGSAGQQQVVFSIKGIDSEKKTISDSATSRLAFTVIPAEAPDFTDNIEKEAYQFVPLTGAEALLDEKYKADEMELVEATPFSGALPAGLSASPFVEGEKGGLRISGVPSGASTTTAAFQLTLRRKSDGSLMKTMPVTVKISVKALGGNGSGSSGAIIPGFSKKRIWQHLPMTNGEGRLVGLLNLTASTNGGWRARYTRSGRMMTFAAAALESVSKDEGTGAYRATAQSEKAGSTLKVTFASDVEVSATLTSDAGCAGYVAEAGSVPWARSDEGASAWKGRYAVAFPSPDGSGGSGLLSISLVSRSMIVNGNVTYNGVLPSGKPFNGATAIVPAVPGATRVKLPIFWSSATEEFSALLVLSKDGGRIEAAADPDVRPFWSSDGESHDLSVCGGLFEAEDWLAAWARDFGGAKELPFTFDGQTGPATVRPDGMSLMVGMTGSAEQDGFQLENIALNKVSGLVTGTLKIPFAGAKGQFTSLGFRGVLTPRVQGQFMVGVAWYRTVDGSGFPIRKAVPVGIAAGSAH